MVEDPTPPSRPPAVTGTFQMRVAIAEDSVDTFVLSSAQTRALKRQIAGFVGNGVSAADVEDDDTEGGADAMDGPSFIPGK